MDFALPLSLFTLPDNAVLSCVLDNIRHVNMWRCHPILEASVFWGIYLEGELVTLVLVGKARDDDGSYRAVIEGEARHEDERYYG